MVAAYESVIGIWGKAAWLDFVSDVLFDGTFHPGCEMKWIEALLEAGVRPESPEALRGTAMHWAANLGLDRWVARLIAKGADVNLRDGRYHSAPLGWAIHGRFHSPADRRGRHPQVVALLVAAGATVEPRWLADERVRADRELFTALSAPPIGVPVV